MNALYAYVMTLPQLALSSLAIGLVIGVGLSLLVVWAYRARARVQEETSLAIPAGITDVLHSMDDAAAIVDASGLVLAASQAATRFGIDVGSTLDNPELRQLVRGVREAGGTATESMRLTRGGLSLDPRLVSARASVIGTRLVLLIIRDVTEQERLEQMRYDFVANTSHELKTPVGAVSLLAEAIESAADDPAQVRIFAARISAEAGRLGQLTGRIMSLSRLQAEDGLTTVGPVAIDEVIASSIEAHVVQADSAGVELARGGDRGVWVRGEKLRLHRINTPELRGADEVKGKAARDHLKSLVEGKAVLLQTVKDRREKYGRYLAEVWLEQPNAVPVNVNDALVAAGHARYQDY